MNKYAVITTTDELSFWIDQLLGREQKILTYDTETNHPKVWMDDFFMTCWSFYYQDAEHPVIVPCVDYPYAGELGKVDFDGLEEMIKMLMTSSEIKKVGHNCKFDENAIYKTRKYTVKGYFGDTMKLRYVIDPISSVGRNGLDNLITDYYPDVRPYWLNISKFFEKAGHDNYALLPPDILFPYAAYDTFYTDALFYTLAGELSTIDEQQGSFFVQIDDEKKAVGRKTYGRFEYAMHVRKCHHLVCGHMERVGTKVDKEMAETLLHHYSHTLNDLNEKLGNIPSVIEFETDMLLSVMAKSRTSRFLRDIYELNGGKPRTPLAKVIAKIDNEQLLHIDNRPKINWGSPKESAAYFYDFLGLTPPKMTEAGAPSTNEEALSILAGQGVEAAVTLSDYRTVSQFLKNYIRPLFEESREKRILHSDGMLHADFKVFQLKTGRISCSSPPLQALPRDGLVKRLYISRFDGGYVLQRDYSGLEVRVLALLTRDPLLVKSFREGGDPHFDVTQKYFFKEQADKKNKSQRSVCKQSLFGRVYGQKDQGLLDLLTKMRVKSPFTGEPITLEECAQFNQLIDELYPSVPEWVKAAHAYAVANLCATSAFGFSCPLTPLRYYQKWRKNKRIPEGAMVAGSLRHAQNYPVQSTASDITMTAGYEILRRMRKERLKSELILIVHDAIYIDTHPSEVLEVSIILREVMDKSHEWLPNILPDFDSSWLAEIPIIGEAEIGVNAIDALPVVGEPSPGDTADKILLKAPEIEEGDLRANRHRELFQGEKTLNWRDHAEQITEWLNMQKHNFSI